MWGLGFRLGPIPIHPRRSPYHPCVAETDPSVVGKPVEGNG